MNHEQRDLVNTAPLNLEEGLMVAKEQAALYRPGTRALRRGIRGQPRGSPVLVQRAVSEDPRWTRALEPPLARPQGKR